MTRASVLRGSAVIAASLFIGCVDTTPLDFVEPELDAAIADSSRNDAAIAGCRQCIVGDGAPCRSVYDQTCASSKCAPAFECMVEIGCFSRPTLEQRIACGLPCLEKVGLQIGVDPAVLALADINECTLGPCAAACPVE